MVPPDPPPFLKIHTYPVAPDSHPRFTPIPYPGAGGGGEPPVLVRPVGSPFPFLLCGL
jgi:hypothetical protein